MFLLLRPVQWAPGPQLPTYCRNTQILKSPLKMLITAYIIVSANNKYILMCLNSTVEHVLAGPQKPLSMVFLILVTD